MDLGFDGGIPTENTDTTQETKVHEEPSYEKMTFILFSASHFLVITSSKKNSNLFHYSIEAKHLAPSLSIFSRPPEQFL